MNRLTFDINVLFFFSDSWKITVKNKTNTKIDILSVGEFWPMWFMIIFNI